MILTLVPRVMVTIPQIVEDLALPALGNMTPTTEPILAPAVVAIVLILDPVSTILMPAPQVEQGALLGEVESMILMDKIVKFFWFHKMYIKSYQQVVWVR